MPRISVLMPAFNAENFIKNAIDSILEQTFTDFKLYILDDCSYDDTANIVSEYEDRRIKLVSNTQGINFLDALNQLLANLDSPIISRMDADDMCNKAKFQKQIEFIDNNPTIGVIAVSSLIQTEINIFSHHSRITHPILHDEIKASTIFGNPVVNSSTMINFKAFDRNLFFYDSNFYPAADYECWFRLLSHGVNFHCIKEYLHIYRHHNSQISSKEKYHQQKKGDSIRFKAINELGIVPSTKEAALHLDFIGKKIENLAGNMLPLTRWFDLLLKKNHAVGYYDQASLTKVILGRINRFVSLSRLNEHDKNILNQFVEKYSSKFSKSSGK